MVRPLTMENPSRNSSRLRLGARTLSRKRHWNPRWALPTSLEFFIDPNRCIGCQACVQACSECDTHKGTPMIHLEYVDRAASPQTVPVVCMHCDSPTCADVCPADAIKKSDEGIVLSARKPRCIACNNCVLACPFGVPKMATDFELMMKCDMCYDRTSAGKMPMCASVCPSGAVLWHAGADREGQAAAVPRSINFSLAGRRSRPRST